MAGYAVDLRQADLPKLPLFSGDKTDIFTCEQWISRVQRAKDLSGWTNPHTMTYVINALRGSAFAYTHSINLANEEKNLPTVKNIVTNLSFRMIKI